MHVLVTGASSGIGEAIAKEYIRRGAKISLVARRRELLDGIAKAAPEGSTAVISRDLTDPSGMPSLLDEAEAALGPVDVLVNNAGILRDKTFLKMEPAQFDAVVAVHLRGSFLVSQAAAKRMVEQKRGGSIVNTTSVSGMLGNFGQANYAAAKAGIYGLTRTMAIELKKQGIRVNALAPIARTRMTDDLPMFQGMPDAHYGPHFVAPVALFLASSLADELSGEVVSVAGAKVSTYRVVESLGVLGEDPTKPWTPQALRDQWDALSKL